MIGALDYSKEKGLLLFEIEKERIHAFANGRFQTRSVFVILSFRKDAVRLRFRRFLTAFLDGVASLGLFCAFELNLMPARGCARVGVVELLQLMFAFFIRLAGGDRDFLVSRNEVNRRIRKGLTVKRYKAGYAFVRRCSNGKVLVRRYSNGEVLVWRYNDGEIFVRRYSDSEILVGRNNADCAFFCFKNFIFEFVWNDR